MNPSSICIANDTTNPPTLKPPVCKVEFLKSSVGQFSTVENSWKNHYDNLCRPDDINKFLSVSFLQMRKIKPGESHDLSTAKGLLKGELNGRDCFCLIEFSLPYSSVTFAYSYVYAVYGERRR